MPYNKDKKYLDRYNIGTTFIAFDRTRGSLPFDSAVTVHVVAVDALRFRPFIEQPAPETVKLTEVGE
jgi:hypothetical protein